ncbi:type II toxin-antitoxin system Phd/YefM family antitoxin [Allokutzneria sp. NRRL B-24872]|uniref:type II toxin-antitoxin system Phd/YefM family antitoxin n=1 Tax=Allokutzneria sp. NRRL B-24872 TaxID=1137961 RepID=UPI001AEFA930|nr:type II toxin-antitoxin system Phd/YefM family antitoxin [Allokutzneria sp. NRRL B-24872]
MNINTEDMVSVTEANSSLSRLLNDASAGRSRIVMRNNKPLAAIVSPEAAARLRHLEELEEDLKLLSLALVRTVTDDGARHSLDDVAAEFGIDPAELDED